MTPVLDHEEPSREEWLVYAPAALEEAVVLLRAAKKIKKRDDRGPTLRIAAAHVSAVYLRGGSPLHDRRERSHWLAVFKVEWRRTCAWAICDMARAHARDVDPE